MDQIAPPAGADGRPPRPAASDEPCDLLQVVGLDLETRGLVVVEGFDHGGMLSHVDATNPDDPERGVVSVGWDGYLIWERWGPAEGAASVEAIIDIVARTLAVEARHGLPAHEPPGRQ